MKNNLFSFSDIQDLINSKNIEKENFLFSDKINKENHVFKFDEELISFIKENEVEYVFSTYGRDDEFNKVLEKFIEEDLGIKLIYLNEDVYTDLGSLELKGNSLFLEDSFCESSLDYLNMILYEYEKQNKEKENYFIFYGFLNK